MIYFLVSTALRRSGYVDRMEKLEEQEMKRLQIEGKSSPAKVVSPEKAEDKKEDKT